MTTGIERDLVESETNVASEPQAELPAEPESEVVSEPQVELPAEPESEVASEPQMELAAEPESEVVSAPGMEVFSDTRQTASDPSRKHDTVPGHRAARTIATTTAISTTSTTGVSQYDLQPSDKYVNEAKQIAFKVKRAVDDQTLTTNDRLEILDVAIGNIDTLGNLEANPQNKRELEALEQGLEDLYNAINNGSGDVSDIRETVDELKEKVDNIIANDGVDEQQALTIARPMSGETGASPPELNCVSAASPQALSRHAGMRAALAQRRQAKTKGKGKQRPKKKRQTMVLNSPLSPQSQPKIDMSEAEVADAEPAHTRENSAVSDKVESGAPDQQDSVADSVRLEEFANANSMESFIAQELEQLQQLEQVEHNMEQQLRQLDALEELNTANATAARRIKHPTSVARSVGSNASYMPQVGRALDAIASDNFEAFKRAMLTIHVGERVFASGDAAVRGRKELNLPNASCAACTPESLARRSLSGKIGDSIIDVAKQNTTSAVWREYLERPQMLTEVPQENQGQELRNASTDTTINTTKAVSEVQLMAGPKLEAAHKTAMETDLKIHQLDHATCGQSSIQELEAAEKLNEQQIEEAQKKRCLSACSLQ